MQNLSINNRVVRVALCARLRHCHKVGVGRAIFDNLGRLLDGEKDMCSTKPPVVLEPPVKAVRIPCHGCNGKARVGSA
eukprot:scaffold5060_cov123-Isochrysis_galbana.AAC.12